MDRHIKLVFGQTYVAGRFIFRKDEPQPCPAALAEYLLSLTDQHTRPLFKDVTPKQEQVEQAVNFSAAARKKAEAKAKAEAEERRKADEEARKAAEVQAEKDRLAAASAAAGNPKDAKVAPAEEGEASDSPDLSAADLQKGGALSV